ncbi:MAG TPA: DUF2141 domain-containing protein [Gammaproteobacteria bacterium]|nr:DUF2141 domain-containing protein [Gammaproteobacteria bacterium]
MSHWLVGAAIGKLAPYQPVREMKMNNRWLAGLAGACLALSAAAFAAGPAHTGTLQVEVDGLSSSQPVYFGLWNSKAGFLSSKPLKGVKVPVDDGKAVWTIKGLPYGVYAVSGWQDLNGNGKMDSNTFGAPVEPIGVSNNAKGHYGPPSYEDARISLDQSDMKIKFELACPMGCSE